MSKKLILIGKHNVAIDKILGINIGEADIYRSKGLLQHLIKRKHYAAIKHIDDIYDMIKHPDYVGRNPNEKGLSYEVIKQYEDNILVGAKFDLNNNCLYISTMHQISNKDIEKRLRTGRLKSFS